MPLSLFNVRKSSDTKFRRKIKDPLYEYIPVTTIENEIIDTPEFQRLDRLYQTPMVRKVYPDSTHTRKVHSLGVMHLYHAALSGILRRQSSLRDCPDLVANSFSSESGYLDNLDSITKGDIRECDRMLEIGRLMALLHDIGHGPFSHLFESVCKEISQDDSSFTFHHESMTKEIIENRFATILNDDIKPDDILYIYDKKNRDHPFLMNILDGPFDVDKLDYINRDSRFSGTEDNGRIDYKRILDGYRIKNGALLLSKSSVGALMNTFHSLQSLYTNLYYHKTCRAFDLMVIDALRLIPDYIKEVALDSNKLLKMDDENFVSEIKTRRSSDKEGLKFHQSWEILKDFQDRKKRYVPIIDSQISVSDISRDISDKLARIKDLEIQYSDIGLKIDYSGTAKGVRLPFPDALGWLSEPNILDEDDNYAPKSIFDHFPSYYNILRSQTILFYAFVKSDALIVKENTINSLKGELQSRVDSLNRLR